MNAKLYESYGKRFIDGWTKHSSSDVSLVVCFEGESSPNMFNNISSNIKFLNLESTLSKKFVDKFSHFYQARGMIFNQDAKNNISVHYNYRYDAIRFSFKIFSIYRCIEENILKNNFAWIDSDIVCLKNFESKDFDIYFPNAEQLASYLGRESFPEPNPYSECGFVAYNFAHKHWKSFIQAMIDTYMNGDIFMLPEWHDCMVFDYTRNIFTEQQNVQFYNLSENLVNCDHPFSQVGLSQFFDHLKGPERKSRGYS
jgi:hypothetical protein